MSVLDRDHPRPDFFIAGAPKCGTTALAEYLSTHPDVLMSRPKEPKYFNTDFDRRHRYALTAEEYEQCFVTDGDPPQAVGEATVWYLYSRDAVPNILVHQPDARFLLMFRNPIDLVQSLHAQFLYGGYEDIADLGAAWRARDARARGQRLPPTCPEPKLLQYGDVACMGSQLRELYRLVPEDRVLVLLLEDMASDPGGTYRGALEFLGLEDDGRSQFPVRNERRPEVYLPVARLLHRGRLVKNRLGIRRSLGVWSTVSPRFNRPRERVTVPAHTHEQMAEFFRPDVELLGRLLDRDLDHWLECR